MNTEELLNNKKELANAKDILRDTLHADPEALKRLDSMNLDMNAIKTALQFLQNNPNISDKEKAGLISETWRISYKAKPPSPEEFLTEKYLGPVAKTIYPRVRKVFTEFMDPTKAYRKLILYPFIGYGKSFCSSITTLYITVLISLMKDPWKMMGLSPASVICQLLCSYSLKKSSELLLEPYLLIIESSSYFEKVHTREKMIQANEEYEHMDHVDKLFYTTASPTSELAFSGNCNIKLASSPNGLLGQSIVSCVLSELAFFTDAGKALSLDTEIKLEDGSSKSMKDIKIGDKLYPINGEENIVEKIMWEGEDTLYEITTDDGRTVKCNAKHLWPVKYYKEGKLIEEVVETQFMIDHSEIEFELLSV